MAQQLAKSRTIQTKRSKKVSQELSLEEFPNTYRLTSVVIALFKKNKLWMILTILSVETMWKKLSLHEEDKLRKDVLDLNNGYKLSMHEFLFDQMTETDISVHNYLSLKVSQVTYNSWFWIKS